MMQHSKEHVQGTTPQHNYRLNAVSLAERRFGEVSCRDYRESLLRVLPHSWTQLADTRLQAAYFARHRASRGAAKQKLAEGGGGKSPPTVAVRMPFADTVDGVMMVPAPQGAGHPKVRANVLVAHSEQGLDIINLFTGASQGRLMIREGVCLKMFSIQPSHIAFVLLSQQSKVPTLLG
jgi:hypothetical protein